MVYRKSSLDDGSLINIMGGRLKELRLKQQLTLEELEERVNISSRMLGNYERGDNVITIETIIKLYNAQVFDDYLDIEDLVQVLIIEPIKIANELDQ
ncbi:helix-turn-helix domain-containing protein [Salinicoccus roseus]|uniref:helix-turn-helix domain-containing protein n=1 Tax=Salinicoccus roseus TaxID=45670 RepID=UPI001CA77EDC|nr:helix-turn-helix transcriptional regulator [Salinicoccus roseus]MBY8910026.1 helix-turn-helix domain-containing protein [Salinicoccus roseus]